MKKSDSLAKYEVLVKQYLRSILEISDTSWYKEASLRSHIFMTLQQNFMKICIFTKIDLWRCFIALYIENSKNRCDCVT